MLVDNGRSELLGSERFRDALHCIRCGACLNTCPVYRRSGGHSYHATIPGPIGSVLNAQRDPQSYHSLPYACSLCGSCTDVCPVKIPLDQQLFDLRGEIARATSSAALETAVDEADQLRDAAHLVVRLVRAHGAPVRAMAAALAGL